MKSKVITKAQANYLYCALMRGVISIPEGCAKTPGTIYLYTNPNNALSENTAEFFRRTIKALQGGNNETAQKLFTIGINEA